MNLLKQIWFFKRIGRRQVWRLASQVAHILSEKNKSIDRSCGNNYIGFKFIFITYKARNVQPKCIDI